MKQRQTKSEIMHSLTKVGVASLLLLIPAVQGVALAANDKQVTPSELQDEDTQKKKITGQVLDEQGEPLIGAVIAIKGTTEKVLADLDGKYTILTGAEAPVIVVSYMGYQTKEVPSQGRTIVNVRMEENEEQLSEVIVTALGIKREEDAWLCRAGLEKRAAQPDRRPVCNLSSLWQDCRCGDEHRTNWLGWFYENYHPRQLVAHRQQPAALDSGWRALLRQPVEQCDGLRRL